MQHYWDVKHVIVLEVELITAYKEKLILEAIFRVDDREVKEEMIIHPNGEYHFHDGNKLEKIVSESSYLNEIAYYTSIAEIKDKANLWCEDLGLPKLTNEI